MPLVNRLIGFVFNVFEVGFTRPVKQLLHIFVQVALVLFETENVVSTLVDNLFGNLCLCALSLRQASANASIVTMHPDTSRMLSSFGIAVISLDLSATLT